MPRSRERARGGAIRYRTKRISRTKYLRIAILRRKGPRGGRTIATVHTIKRSPRRGRGRR
jgi:hypothetical protein